jgi:hypothetical protein
MRPRYAPKPKKRKLAATEQQPPNRGHGNGVAHWRPTAPRPQATAAPTPEAARASIGAMLRRPRVLSAEDRAAIQVLTEALQENNALLRGEGVTPPSASAAPIKPAKTTKTAKGKSAVTVVPPEAVENTEPDTAESTQSAS